MHERVHRLGVAATLLALVTLVGVAYAQTSTTSSTTSSTTTTWTTSAVSGTVLSVDPHAKTVTIKTDAGMSQTFLLADPIWMRSAGKDITVSELKVGDRVRIDPTPGAGTDESAQTTSRLEVLGPGSVQGSTGSTYGAGSPSMGTATQPGSASPQRTVSTERPVLGEPADAGADTDAMPSSAGSTTGRPVSTDRPVLGQKPSPSTTSTSTTTTIVTSPATGRVISVDSTGNIITVETSTGRETFTVNSSTRYMSSGRTVMLSDVQPGDNVTVAFTGTGPDRMVNRVDVTRATSSTSTSTYGSSTPPATPPPTTYGSSTTTTTTPPPTTYRSSTTTTSPSTTTTGTSSAASSTSTSADELPATASPLPFVAILGLLALVGAFLVRATRKQFS